MKRKASIIVPVYNIEKYIGKCIKSILSQTYLNYEVLLIDDGSIDESGAICDYYEKVDSRIRVFHKSNGGISTARNMGLQYMTGEYVCFVDGDDYVESDFLETLINGLENADSDICIMGHIYEDEKGKIIKTIGYSSKVCDAKEVLEDLLIDIKLHSYAWQAIYRVNLFSNIKFPVGENYEDFRVMPYIYIRAKKINYVNAEKYHYIKRDGSISNSKKHLKNDSLSLFVGYMERLDLAENNDLIASKQFLEFKVAESAIHLIYNTTKGLLRINTKEYIMVQNKILKLYPTVRKNIYLNKECRIKLYIFFYLKNLFYLYNKRKKGGLKDE